MNALDRADSDGAPLLPEAQRPLLASLDCELFALLQKGMAMTPAERFTSMDELISALTPYNAAIKLPSLAAVGASAPVTLAELQGAASPQTAWEAAPAGRKRQKKKQPWAVAAIVAASVAAAAGLYFVYGLYTWDKAVAATDNVDFADADRYYRASGPFAVWNDRQVEGGLLNQYIAAGLLYEDGQYEDAAEAFASLDGFARSQEMDVKAVCTYASQLADAGQFDNALNYLSASGIDTSDSTLQETKKNIVYRWALYYIDSKEYVTAYNLLSGLSGYSDSEAILSKLKDTIYNDAIQKYRAGQYNKAEPEFNICCGYQDSASYLILISAQKPLNTDILDKSFDFDKLFSLIGFEDTDQIILNNSEIAEEFLRGTWRTARSTYFKMDSNFYTNCNFPGGPSGDYYFIEAGIYSVGNDESSATQYLRFTILDKDTISVYCYYNGETYTMYRQ